MGQEHCRTCELLKEFYRLKVNQFLLAARSAATWPGYVHTAEEDLQALKNESLEALRALMRHAKACYGLSHDEAA